MTTATTLEDRALHWRGVLIAFGLTLVLMMLAGIVGSMIRIPIAALLVAATALVAAGVLAIRVRPGTKALETAIGATLATVFLTVLPLVVSPETAETLTAGQIGISVLLSGLFAFSLAWMGARLALPRDMHAGPPHSASHRDAPTSV